MSDLLRGYGASRTDGGPTDTPCVNEMISAFLKYHGYDGLVNPDQECGCSADDLAPCGQVEGSCEAAHAVKTPGGEFDILFFSGLKSKCAECKDGGHSQETEEV